MRGSERPAKVRWTRPFLLPLKPLSDDAARQTFIDITDNSCHEEGMNQLLQLTDNMPLAVDLLAHLVDYEGLSNVLGRWETEKTSLLSAGHDRKSNLDASIRISLSSPRITSGSKQLLSLLSILPDGLSAIELVQSKLPIQDIFQCKAALLATSLAYQDDKKRLRSLVPIREHIQRFSPPSQSLIQCIGKYFHSILDLYQKYNGAQLAAIITQITLNMGNMHQILLQQLHADYPDLADAIHCTLSLNSFYRLTRSSCTTLMDSIPSIFLQHHDSQLEAYFLTEVLFSHLHKPIASPEALIARLMSHFQHFNDPVLECECFCQSTVNHLILVDQNYTR
jgi:hypothetical protein